MNAFQSLTDTTVTIRILGPGCANCKRLEAHAREAAGRLGLHADLEKVEDIGDIMAYGVIRTPGLVVNERVLAAGRVPSVREIMSLLSAELQAV